MTLRNSRSANWVQHFPSFDGDVLPHRQLRLSFRKNQNIRPESAHRPKSQEAPDEGIDLSRDR